MRLWEMYNIPRNKMPQINKKHLKGYPQTLQVVDINTVTPSQSDRVPGLVDKTLKAFKAGEKELMDKPMVVDRDLNIVNGHHRFDALKQMGMTKVPVLKVDVTLPELIDDFSHTVSDKPVGEAQSVKLSDKEIGDVKLGTGENLWLATYNDGSTKKVVAQSTLGVRKQLKEPDGKYKKPAEPSNYELGIRRIEKVSMPDRRPDTKWNNRPVKKQKAHRRVPRKSHDQDKFGPAAFDAEKAALRKKIDDLEFEREQRRLMGEGNKAQKGIPANATQAELKSARKAGGAKGKRAHWLLNMRKGNKKNK